MNDLPTHTAEGKPVLGYDTGTSRPTSAPLTSDAPGGANTRSPQAEQPRADDLAKLDGAIVNPVLVLPTGTRFATAAVLSRISQRRMEQGPDLPMEPELAYNAAEWLAAIDSQLTATGHILDDENLVNSLVDVAARTVVAIEHLQEAIDFHKARQDEVPFTREEVEAITGPGETATEHSEA